MSAGPTPITNAPENHVLPKCPHCEKRMPIVGIYAYAMPQLGGRRLLFVTTMCPHCNVLLHTEMIREDTPEQPADPPANPPSNIWKPS